MTPEETKQLWTILNDIRQAVLDEEYGDDMVRRQHAAIATGVYMRAILANEAFIAFIEEGRKF